MIEERRECEKLWRKAIEIDPDLRGPHVALALYAIQYDWDWKHAKRELQTVLATGPYAATEDILSNLYLIQGRRAVVEAIAGQRDEAFRILRPLEQNYQSGRFLMSDFADVYAALGDEPNTVKWLERAMDAREGPPY